jgi:hypothetical protein
MTKISAFFLLVLLLVLSVKIDSKKQLNRQTASSPIDHTTLGWKLTFEEEFDDPHVAIQKGVSPSCFTRTPLCLYNSWVLKDCKPQYHDSLKNLNKCLWVAYDQYSWMDFQAAPNVGVNTLKPDQIEVKNGHLYLYADKNKEFVPPKDCGVTKYDPEVLWENRTKNCETSAGMIMSRPYPEANQTGFAQEFGRFEVRAKLAKGPGSWTAHWMLPVESNVTNLEGERCGWPFDSEIDIMEQWAKDKDYRQYKASIHTGDCKRYIYSTEGHEFKARQDLTETFHTYAVEWNKDTIRFTFDDQEVGFFSNGSRIRSQYFQVKDKTNYDEKDLKKRFNHTLKVPTGPFYYLLTSSVEGVTKSAPDFSKNFLKQIHVIDYVRAYRRCTPEDDPRDCKDIKIKSKGVDSYNTSKGETAFAELNVYPNPILKSQGSNEVTIRFTLMQDCQEVDMDLINMLGQKVLPLTNQGGNQILSKVALQSGQDNYYQLYTHNLQAGMYFVRATYKKCGLGLSGQGNQIFKLLVQ